MLNRLLPAALVATSVCAVPAAAETASYTTIFSFGDSLSDAGNLYLATPLTIPATPPYTIEKQPIPPYYQTPGVNAGVFSNGPVWTQNLSQALGLGPLLPSLAGGNDFAYGGATTGTTDLYSATQLDLPAQVTAFLARSNGAAPSGALYTVWIGASDVLQTLGALAAPTEPLTPQAADKVISEAVQNEVAQIQTLVADGARNLLVFNVPNLGLAPEFNAGAQKGEASALSALYNSDLSTRLASVTGATIDLVDAYSFLNGVAANGPAFGLTDTTDACFTGTGFGGPTSGTECADPNQYLYWDNVHPSATAHRLFADQAEAALALGAPEPSTWVMLALGFAGLGTVAMRRARRPAVAT